MEARAANLAYDLVGGRLVHLKFFVGVHHLESFDGMPSLLKNDYHLTRFTEVKRNLSRDANADVVRAELMPKGIYYDEGSQIINALQKKRLTERDYYRQFGFQKGPALLEKNVFALHVDSGVVTFQSRLIERFCESEQDLWQTKGKD